ncbi:MAG: alpha/beta hydrolase family protein [Armatimonadota bacterium]|jgi:dienelactone hydrolase
MIHDWLSEEARALTASALPVPMYADEWERTQEQRRRMWLEMLGLWPLPERTPMEPTITGRLARDGYVIEKLHLQPEPGCYVTANLLMPDDIDEPLPCVIYHCGHAATGKANPPYHALARYYARNGYVCLILDTIEIGEGLGDHHGTNRNGRWDWYSRGYTPAGTEVWHGMRALDYLQTRPEADASRVALTGKSGGGAISWFQGAADERVTMVAPVCQTGSVEMLAAGRVIDSHCDCAVWMNYYRWDWPQIGALIAPRPLLISAGSDDPIWRPWGYRVTVNRIRETYDVLGVGERVALIDEIVPHAYTPRSRMEILRWFNRYLKDSDEPVSEDASEEEEPEENLLVFPEGVERPEDAMPRVHEILLPPVEPPDVEDADRWPETQQRMLAELRALTFRNIAEPICPRVRDAVSSGGSEITRVVTHEFESGDGWTARARLRLPIRANGPRPTLVAANTESVRLHRAGGEDAPGVPSEIGVCMVEVRGTGNSAMEEQLAWSERRALGVLGYTLPERQIVDVLAAIRVMREQSQVGEIATFGRGATSVHAIYAALLDASVSEVVLQDPPATHLDPETPELPGVLRVGDLPQNLALLFPRAITFVGEMSAAYQWTVDLYERLGMADRVRVIGEVREWRPYEA